MRNNQNFFSLGFSLIEVLLAVMILGIGLIMVASVFPVAADWTRQSTEDVVSQTIARSALSVIQTRYSPTSPFGATAGKLATLTNLGSMTTTSPITVFPNFKSIPVTERSFQYGTSTPFPSTNPATCTYFWTALVRVQPGQMGPLASRNYDVYILVFHKGDAAQQFLSTGYTPPAGASEIVGVRDPSDVTLNVNGSDVAFSHLLEPTLVQGPYAAGTYSATSTPAISGAFPAVGAYGIGALTGTVFRQGINTIGGGARPYPLLGGQTTDATASPSEQVIFSPVADGTTANPLVYIYQTTISF